MNSIQQIFREHGQAYLKRYGGQMPANHKKAIHAIRNCGTGAFGTHLFNCTGCGQVHQADSSCGNRHCPTCQTGKSDEWLEKQLIKVLPVNYFMVTFTVPQELRRLIRSNQRIAYAALFKAAVDAMKKLAKDPRFVGCDTAGFTGILHTWTRQLEYHPHVHFIVPGGGIDQEGKEWKASRADFFIHAKPLALIYRGIFMEELKKAGLAAPPCVWDPDWVVDCRHVGNGKAALKYLSQYVFRVAIAPSRIIRVVGGEIWFKYQRSGEKKWRTCKLKIFEFIRRRTIPVGHYFLRKLSFRVAHGSSTPCRTASLKSGTTDSCRPTPRCRSRRYVSSSVRSTRSSLHCCPPRNPDTRSPGSARRVAGSSAGASLSLATPGRAISPKAPHAKPPRNVVHTGSSVWNQCRTGLSSVLKNREKEIFQWLKSPEERR